MIVVSTLILIAGLIVLVFAIPELIAQIAGVTIRLGSITYGPIPKIQIGRFAIYFKGIYRYVFIMSLFVLVILGLLLVVWSMLILYT
jgi:hypothetical protein